MSRFFSHIVVVFLVSNVAFSQQDDLYDHGLDEKKWNELRDAIRYENQPDESAGREWTYESRQEYESAKRNSGGSERGNGNGGRNGGSGRDRGGNSGSSREVEADTPPTITNGPNFSGLGGLGYVLLVVFIVVIAALVFYLFVNREKGGKAVVPVNLDDTAPTEIPLTELQRLLQEALARGDYRGAVRIYFIFIIRDLSQKNWIRWEKEKTNFQYLREMTGRNEYRDFNQSVSYFEIIWYGKRDIDKNTFDEIRPDFTRLLDKLGVK